MPKVEDVSIWLRWAVDPTSALQVLLLPLLLALPMHFLLSLLCSYFPLLLQGVGNPFTPFFLLSHLTLAPERLSSAAVHPELVETTQLTQGPQRSRVALLYRCVVLLPSTRAEPYSVSDAGEG
jgi:hypothetical protein